MGYSNSDLKGDILGTSKTAKLAEKYGVGGVHFAHPDGRSGKPTRMPEDVEKAVVAKMNQDYDVRRSLEAASLAGNKKAQKIGSIDNIESALAAEKFMKKTHKNRMDLGGKYSSISDTTGVTDYWVNKDRDKQNSMFATKDDLSALDQQQAEVVEQTQEPYKESEGLTEAKERVQAWEDTNAGTDPSPYGGGSGMDFKSMAYGADSNRDASGEPANGDKAQGQLDKFKQELKQRKNIKKVF